MERPPSIIIRTCSELLHTGDTCRSSQQLMWHKCQKDNWSGSIEHLQTAIRRPRPVLMDLFTFEFYELCNKIWSLTWVYMWNLYADAFCLTLRLQTHPKVSSTFVFWISFLKTIYCLYLVLWIGISPVFFCYFLLLNSTHFMKFMFTIHERTVLTTVTASYPLTNKVITCHPACSTCVHTTQVKIKVILDQSVKQWRMCYAHWCQCFVMEIIISGVNWKVLTD